MAAEISNLSESKLLSILAEMKSQTHVAEHYGKNKLPFDRHMALLHEYIEIGGEYGVAYESIVATLEQRPFKLEGKTAVCLLEVGLLMGFKTDRECDAIYSRERD